MNKNVFTIQWSVRLQQIQVIYTEHGAHATNWSHKFMLPYITNQKKEYIGPGLASQYLGVLDGT